MACTRRFVWRALIGAAAGSALYLGSTAGITTASAHVQASSNDAVRGSTALITFQVPNESTTGAATTKLTLDLTNVAAVQTEAKPGWTTKLDRDSASRTVRSVTPRRSASTAPCHDGELLSIPSRRNSLVEFCNISASPFVDADNLCPQ